MHEKKGFKPTNFILYISTNISIRNAEMYLKMEVFFIMAKLLKSTKNLDFYLEDFMEYCYLKELSKKIMNSYESTLQLFFKYLQEEKDINNPQDTKKEDIEDYILFTKERGKYSYVSDEKTVSLNHPTRRIDFGKQVSDCTINNYIRNIKVFFNYCAEKKYIKKNPVDKLCCNQSNL